ncbi:hypothetical protein WME76_35190 [Sorangium sp. So ce119]
MTEIIKRQTESTARIVTDYTRQSAGGNSIHQHVERILREFRIA